MFSGAAVLLAAGALTAGTLSSAKADDGHGSKTTTTSRTSKGDKGSKDRDRDHHGTTTTGTTTTGTTTTGSTVTTSTSPNQVCGLDIVYLKTSAEGDLFEIQGGQLALTKSSNPQVRQLAQTLITDHTKSLQDTQQLASQLGVQLPNEPSPSEQWELEEVGEMHGSEFNHDYSELEIKDHEQDIDEATDEVQLGCNSQVRDEARQEIPMLQKHLSLSRQAYAASGPEYGNSNG
jgi:putative membrane protein